MYGEGLFKILGYFYAFVKNYRIIEGLCRALRKIIPNFPTLDHSTIHRRLKYELKNDKIAGNMLIVDSTGFRLGRTTEYVEYRHGLRRRKKWIKLHIITDGKKIVKLIITKNNVGDSPAFREMFRTLKSELKDVNIIVADSAYDSPRISISSRSMGSSPSLRFVKTLPFHSYSYTALHILFMRQSTISPILFIFTLHVFSSFLSYKK